MSDPDLFDRARRSRRPAVLTLVFAGVLATGAATGALSDGRGQEGNPTAAPAGSAPVADRRAVTEAAARALADGKSATEAARRAVSRSGDRWGAVYSEGEYAEFEQSLDGEYTGVGLWARRDVDGRVEVARVQHRGPAERAGIRKGDRLTSIDGRPVDGLPVTDVVALLRGDAPGGDAPAAGTSVVLGLERGARAWHETLRRARLTTDSVTVQPLGDRAGDGVLVRVAAFTKGTGAQVREAVRQAPQGAGILLDLRGNSGGLVAEATATASAFLDGGLVATYDVEGEQHALHAARGGDVHRPLVTMVDGGTMSAAELLTGALQDRGRAVVVGTRTFGKGSVQMPSKLPDGSVAELTVGHYRTPAGHSLDGRGITPDLEAEDAVQKRAETVLSGLGSPS
ncbi:peptidase S41 [Streptomyces sulfonofaciens]|uniref:Peptidase S41 n=1 Tax=Streptomyces sulfonofaciens TaxID=68272 RepID=A0A919G2B9_9ACTN|nr:S41 family peptidase [Streptomyces sulfonofaciens]GHH76349.1 peptidase S41 [Streptomyces sulfonofaciens]